MRLDDLDTPAVICDLDVLERNLEEMAEHCRSLGLSFRAHTKAHKIPELAHQQVRSGSNGIVCQKLGEAEQMVAASLDDILIPYNIVGGKKLERLSRLARRARITVAVDSETTVRGIAQQASTDNVLINLLIEMDTGAARCGTQSPEETLDLARTIDSLPGVHFAGIMIYPSRADAKSLLDRTISLLREAGLEPESISGGGTGHEAISRDLGCTETRSGSYIWEGLSRIRSSEDLNPSRCPLSVLCTVVSVPTPGRVVIDGGMKTFASYPPVPYGHCIEHPEVRISKMSVEHGQLDASDSSHEFCVGERVRMIPLHQEMCLNLHDELVGVRGDRVEVIWTVAGRGKVQ